MKISELTVKRLLAAIKIYGEDEVNHVLQRLNERDKSIIDEITDLCSNQLDINKSFLFIKNNRQKKDCLTAIVYILRKHNIRPRSIFRYFGSEDLKVNELYTSFFKLNEDIPGEAQLKNVILSIEIKAKPIFEKHNIK